MTTTRRCKGKTQKNTRCRVMCKKTEFCHHHQKQCTQCESTCSICLNTLTRPATLHCGHGFHTLCVRNWSHHGSSCPLCRTDFKSSDIRQFRLHLPPVGEEECSSGDDDTRDDDSEYIPSPRPQATRRRVQRRRRQQVRSATVTARENLENRGLLLRLLDVFLSSSPP